MHPSVVHPDVHITIKLRPIHQAAPEHHSLENCRINPLVLTLLRSPARGHQAMHRFRTHIYLVHPSHLVHHLILLHQPTQAKVDQYTPDSQGIHHPSMDKAIQIHMYTRRRLLVRLPDRPLMGGHPTLDNSHTTLVTDHHIQGNTPAAKAQIIQQVDSTSLKLKGEISLESHNQNLMHLRMHQGTSANKVPIKRLFLHPIRVGGTLEVLLLP